MPRLVRLYITQVLIGFGISAVFVAGLLATNTMNLWHLVSHSSDGILAGFILWFANGIVFAGVQFAIRIMRMAGEDDTGPRGGKRERIRVDMSKPVRVKVEAERRDPFDARR